MNGIPAPIISRAVNLANLACQGEDLVAICAAMSPEEEEDLEDAEMTARAFLEQEFDEPTSSEDPRSALESVLGSEYNKQHDCALISSSASVATKEMALDE
jgi:DNA mismatch repair protein MSH5